MKYLISFTLLAFVSELANVSVVSAAPKSAIWHCQADHRLACGKTGCKLDKDLAAAVTLNRMTRQIEICLYSQCLAGKAQIVRGGGSDVEEYRVEASSKPAYPNPISMVLQVRFDWRQKRFLLSRPGRIFHGGPCLPKTR